MLYDCVTTSESKVPMNQRAIVLFKGDPREEGQLKSLPSRLLTALHDELIHVISSSDEIDLLLAEDVQGEFCIRREDSVGRFAATSLSQKIDLAFSHGFSLGYQSVLVLAGDIVGLELSVLRQAFGSLESEEPAAVVGPSGDGGFYLLGLNRPADLAWESLGVGSIEASARLMAGLQSLRFEVRTLPRLDDVDSFDDAIRLIHTLSPRFYRLKRRLLSTLQTALDYLPQRSVSAARPLLTLSLLRAPPRAA